MPDGIYKNIDCSNSNHTEFNPQEHQKKLLDYFLDESKHKGLLVFHKLGSGKSCSSIMISDKMIKTSKVKKVFVFTPGSLRQNFIEEYCDKCGYKPKYLKKYYTFITSNYRVGEKLPDFNNSLVIIDEVHNLINGVKNQSKHFTLIYNSLMKSNCRILALTGTPIYNYIWEWPLLGNLLKPDTFDTVIRDGELDTAAFMIKFNTDKDGNITPKKPKLFSSQLQGIISYFPGKNNEFYPRVIYETPIKIPMTPLQDEKYWDIALYENDIRMKGPPSKSMLKKDSKKYTTSMEEFIMASKYIQSRAISNFFYPDPYKSNEHKYKDEVYHIGKVLKYIYEPTGEIAEFAQNLIDKYSLEIQKLEIEPEEIEEKINKIKNYIKPIHKMEDIGWVRKELFKDKKLFDVYSRKIAAVIVNILVNWKAKHVLFTFFKTKSGVNILHALFKMCGIKTEIYSGDISDTSRNRILQNFNHEKNRYGDQIKILLITEAGAEGINILEAQHMHILESSSTEMKIQQAIGRVVRYKSHMVEGRKKMKKNEQVVHIWRYWSVSNPEPFLLKKSFFNENGENIKINKTIVNKTTVDEILYKKGIRTVNTIQSFLSLLKKSSVTPYDIEEDKENLLKDYGFIPINPSLKKACEISNIRFVEKNNKSD